MWGVQRFAARPRLSRQNLDPDKGPLDDDRWVTVLHNHNIVTRWTIDKNKKTFPSDKGPLDDRWVTVLHNHNSHPVDDGH